VGSPPGHRRPDVELDAVLGLLPDQLLDVEEGAVVEERLGDRRSSCSGVSFSSMSSRRSMSAILSCSARFSGSK
jgi:hypothetical protein